MSHGNLDADDGSVGSEPQILFPESDLSKGIVGWDEQNDPQNPRFVSPQVNREFDYANARRNFTTARKWTIMIILSCMIILSFLASSIVAPAAPRIDVELDNESPTLSSFITTIFTLGYMVGPLVLSPLSEIYGRLPVIHSANVIFTITHVGAALAPNLGQLLAFRLLSGISGSAGFSTGAGIIADLFDIHERGVANAVMTLASVLGPVLGPLVGGIITQRAHWRWIFWTLLIACATVAVMMGLFMRETNAAVIINHKIRQLRKELGEQDLRSAYDFGKHSNSQVNAKVVLTRGVLRPWKMLFRSPLLVIFCLMVGFISALLYILLTTTSSFFQEVYSWSLEASGLAYLGLGTGSLIGLILFAKTSDLITVRLTKANHNVYQPEMRLVTAFLPALFIPITFFWYGWSTQMRTHWIVPLISLAPFGFSQIGINATVQAYLIDASGPYAASSMACVTAVRCLCGSFLPLAGPSLYAHLGLGWGNSLLGFVSLAMVPFPLLLYRYGERLRERYPLHCV